MATSTGGRRLDVEDVEPLTAFARRDALIEHLARELLAVSERRTAEVTARDAEIAELRDRVEVLERRDRTQRRRAERHARQLEDLRTSETWRVGVAALWLPRRIRSVLSAR